MRGIRAMMNIAKREGLINKSQYPFSKGKYEIKTAEGIKKALTLDQIARFVKYTDGDKKTEFHRDIWFFIYLCNGINVSDLVKLKFKDIIDGEICFVREKTKRTTKNIKEIRVVITPEMQMIIDKWGNVPKPDNYIFDLLLNYSNDYIKHKREVHLFTKRLNITTNQIGEALGIGKITSYTARYNTLSYQLKTSNLQRIVS